jgi:hypothetical protein
MNSEEQQRFDFLRQGPCVPPEYIRDFYGLPWPLPEDVRQDYELSRSQRRKPSNCVNESVSRYELESFMARRNLVPKKWMAARLGMTEVSLDELFARLDELGMRRQRYVVYNDLIADSFSEDLVPNLPSLRFRTFYDHNSFCERLHAELGDRIEIQPLRCATSERLEEYPRQFASSFDCVTLAAVSNKHQLWLDFRKPLNLNPDRCSKLFYVENREILRPYCAGTQEPDNLDEYVQFLAGQQNA